jgi:hypothetical protein
MIVNKDPKYFSKIFDFSSDSPLLEDFLLLFNSENIDCILILHSIYTCTEKLDEESFTEVKEIYIPALLLFNKSILKETLTKLPRKC